MASDTASSLRGVRSSELDPMVVYIAGTGRNGSTLLGMLLEHSSESFFAGELTHVWQRSLIEDQLCGCGAPFTQCSFWRAVIREAFGAPSRQEIESIVRLRNRISSFRKIPALVFRSKRQIDRVPTQDEREYGDLYRTLVLAVSKTSGKNCVIDSSKYPTDLAAIYRCKILPVKVIHLIRDCRAVVYAWKKQKRRPEIYWVEQNMPRYTSFQTALAWRLFNQTTERLFDPSKDQYRFLKYEAFVEEYPSSLASLIDWIVGERSNYLGSSKGENHTVSGNPCRFDFDFNRIQLDETWKENLSFLDRQIVLRICGSLQRRYGYVD